MFLEIEAMIEKMEDREITLDESFLLYQQGIGRLKECSKVLDEVEKKMQILTAEGGLEEM